MGRHLSAEIGNSFERKLIVENVSIAAAKNILGEDLLDRDRASLEEIIKLFNTILEGEKQVRSPSLSAISINEARATNRIGSIYNTRFKFSQFIIFIGELKQTASDMLDKRRISIEKRRQFEGFLELLSESEGKEIERFQSQPIGSYSVV